MKPPLETRVIDPARAWRPGPQYAREQHIEVTGDIAEQRFAFPTPEYPHFRTFVNEPETQQPVYTNYGRELRPDIVTLEWPERVVRIVAEVLTPDQITADNAWDAWKPGSRLAGVAFYLYVPAGYLRQAGLLLQQTGIRRKDVGLRTWRRIVGRRQVDIGVMR